MQHEIVRLSGISSETSHVTMALYSIIAAVLNGVCCMACIVLNVLRLVTPCMAGHVTSGRVIPRRAHVT